MSIRLHLLVTTAIFCAAFAPVKGFAQAAPRYALTYPGAPDGLEDKLKIISTLEKGARRYPTHAALRRAAARDAKAFEEALKAAGYYAGKARVEITPATDEGKTQVAFNIEPGPAFIITEYEILFEDAAPDRPASLAEANITPDYSAAGAALRDVQLKFLNHLWESGYPAAEIISRRSIANMAEGKANAVFVFKSGPKAKFGEPKVSGVKKTKPEFVRKLKTWQIGEEYDRSKVVAYRDKLTASNLFSAIDIAPGTPDAAGAAPIIVALEERKRRTIGAGVSYSTSEGPGGRLFFENRNIFGAGETLHIEMSGSALEQSIDFVANKPLPNLGSLAFANFEFSNETTDAFNARSIALSGGLAKKWLDDRLETRGGFGLETSNVKDNGLEERNYYVSAPFSVLWNSENDLLDPTRGVQAKWTVTPYTGTDTFTQTEFSARSRFSLGENDTLVIAARGALGATFGVSFNNLPLNKRYYTGGAGSVRGYAFQEAGPLDAQGDPFGGRSYIEGAIEARIKITDTIQLAGFADAGSVSTQNTPDFGEKFFVGVGGGVRYFTPIGPIRADIAFPLEPRVTDRDFQILISIGQPF